MGWDIQVLDRIPSGGGGGDRTSRVRRIRPPKGGPPGLPRGGPPKKLRRGPKACTIGSQRRMRYFYSVCRIPRCVRILRCVKDPKEYADLPYFFSRYFHCACNSRAGTPKVCARSPSCAQDPNVVQDLKVCVQGPQGARRIPRCAQDHNVVQDP
jgi:hypothetical protein